MSDEIPAGYAIMTLNRLFATEADLVSFVENNMSDTKIVKTWRTEAWICEVLTPVRANKPTKGKK